jgi:prophage regulatory protein
MLRTAVVIKRRARSNSSHYADIKNDLFIEAVRIGSRATGTADYEVDALIAARIAGKSDDEIRSLVKQLRDARKSAT